jgi:hypothetical protein
MKPILLLAAALIFVASAKLGATESLIFDGGGYHLQILIGSAEKPVVAQVLFTPPGGKEWINLPRNLLRIEKFDFDKGILLMHFSSQKDPDLPPPFSLSVKKEHAVLSIKGKKIKSTFNWEI